jgi:NAD(P)-dependent dehydrogenase (short-subunit alcohol dehydrogenase family)
MTFARLDGKVAVVTGGAGLIGSVVVRELAIHGARVAIVDTAAKRAGDLAKDVESAGGTAEAWAGDVGDESQVTEILDSVIGRWGHVDALVTAAAPLALVRRDSGLASMAVGVWDDMMHGTLRSTMLTCRAALPHLTASGGGSIVTVASIHASAGDAGITAYSAAKAGIVALSRSIATQYGRAAIRCNAVLPGTIPAPDTDPALVAGRVRHQVIGRPGNPGDVAHLVHFLCAQESSFITGQAITVDGGTLIHLPSYADGGSFPAPGGDDAGAPAS